MAVCGLNDHMLQAVIRDSDCARCKPLLVALPSTPMRRCAHEARWRSGYVADCKSAHAGSIPARASNRFRRNSGDGIGGTETPDFRGISPIRRRSLAVSNPAQLGTKAWKCPRVSGAELPATVSVQPRVGCERSGSGYADIAAVRCRESGRLNRSSFSKFAEPLNDRSQGRCSEPCSASLSNGAANRASCMWTSTPRQGLVPAWTTLKIIEPSLSGSFCWKRDGSCRMPVRSLPLPCAMQARRMAGLHSSHLSPAIFRRLRLRREPSCAV